MMTGFGCKILQSPCMATGKTSVTHTHTYTHTRSLKTEGRKRLNTPGPAAWMKDRLQSKVHSKDNYQSSAHEGQIAQRSAIILQSLLWFLSLLSSSLIDYYNHCTHYCCVYEGRSPSNMPNIIGQYFLMGEW
eukprot:1136703-Pelagomonas_calceolata.AAC.2